MSAESPAASRPPQSNSAKSGSGPEEPDSESRREKTLGELPDPADKVEQFLDEFGDRAWVPMSDKHGRELRPECYDEEHNMREVETGEAGTECIEELAERRAVPWWRAVAAMLDWHEEYHRSALRLEYGVETDPTHTLLDVDLDNSWMAAYQNKERARLKALERETCGYQTCEVCDKRYCEEPDEHATEYVAGRFKEPVVVLTGRTASGAGRPPVEHAREITDAWVHGGVRRSLRYEMSTKLGLASDEWVRWTQGEPHPGEGENEGYHHAHDIVILDAAAADGDVTAATVRPVIESHVETCEHAGPDAHDLDKSREEWVSGDVETVTVKEVDGEIEESVASYAAAYLANDKKDLLERPPEYLAWAASMWATDTRKATGTDSRTHAIEADKCRRNHYQGEQETAHGEQVTYSNKRDYKAECVMCGSPWDVEQGETLVAAKRVAGPEVAADGGAVPERASAEQTAEEKLRESWSSARASARSGGEPYAREVNGRPSGSQLEGCEVRLGGGEDWCAACHTESPDGECTATAYREVVRGWESEVSCPRCGYEWCTEVGVETVECPICAECKERYEWVEESVPEVVARVGGYTPLPPEHFGEHRIVEGREDAERTVTTGSEQYRGDGHIAFEYERPPEVPEEHVVSFERPPQWRAKAIIRDGEELPATGGTTEKRPLKLPSAPEEVVRMFVRSGGRATCRECGRCHDAPADVVEHEHDAPVEVWYTSADVERPEVSCSRCGYTWRCDPDAETAECPICSACAEQYEWIEEDVPVVSIPDGGRDTPAEETVLEYEEFAEALPGRFLDAGDGEGRDPGEERDRDRGEQGDGEKWTVPEPVSQHIENNPTATVTEILGRFNLSPDRAGEVEAAHKTQD